MKRPILVLLLLTAALGARAQRAEGPHLSAGIAVGTTGAAAEASVLFPREIGFRAGFNWLNAGVPLSDFLSGFSGGDGRATVKFSSGLCMLTLEMAFSRGDKNYKGSITFVLK